jgi:hypothetical protein
VQQGHEAVGGRRGVVAGEELLGQHVEGLGVLLKVVNAKDRLRAGQLEALQLGVEACARGRAGDGGVALPRGAGPGRRAPVAVAGEGGGPSGGAAAGPAAGAPGRARAAAAGAAAAAPVRPPVPGVLKSGMPALTLMPAPTTHTMLLALPALISSAIPRRSKLESTGGGFRRCSWAEGWVGCGGAG